MKKSLVMMLLVFASATMVQQAVAQAAAQPAGRPVDAGAEARDQESG